MPFVMAFLPHSHSIGHTLDEITRLQQDDWLRVCERKTIFEIQVTLAIEIKTLVSSLHDTYMADNQLMLVSRGSLGRYTSVD